MEKKPDRNPFADHIDNRDALAADIERHLQEVRARPAYIVGMPEGGTRNYSILHREPDGRTVSAISPSCTRDEAVTMVAALNARFYAEEVSDDELAAFVHDVEGLATCIMPLPGRSEENHDPIAQRKMLVLLMATLRAAQAAP